MTKFAFGDKSNAKLEGVNPQLVNVIRRAIEITDVDFAVIEGLRSVERQRELVARGASKTMNSRHITGHAVDLWPIDPRTGKLVPGNDNNRLWELLRRVAGAVKVASTELGVPVEWGGDWKSFPDGPHFQLPRK